MVETGRQWVTGYPSIGYRPRMLTNLRFPVADDHQFQCDVIRSLLERLHASAVHTVNGGDASFRASGGEACTRDDRECVA